MEHQNPSWPLGRGCMATISWPKGLQIRADRSHLQERVVEPWYPTLWVIHGVDGWYRNPSLIQSSQIKETPANKRLYVLDNSIHPLSTYLNDSARNPHPLVKATEATSLFNKGTCSGQEPLGYRRAWPVHISRAQDSIMYITLMWCSE